MSLAPAPPHLRHSKPGTNMTCGSCKMFDRTENVCWGYGNYEVDALDVCDSFAPDPVEPDDDDVTGDNLQDGSVSAGKSSAQGLADATGTLSSTEPMEDRDVPDTDMTVTVKIDGKAIADGIVRHTLKSASRGLDTETEEPSADNTEVEEDAVEDEVDETVEDERDTEVESEERDESEAEVSPEEIAAAEIVDEDESSEEEDEDEDEDEDEERDALPEPVKRRYKARHKSTPAPQPEVRIRLAGMELRSVDGTTATLSGTPVVYNTPYDVYDMMGRFSERMADTVVDGLLDTVDCRFLFNHDGMPLARTISGTLELDSSSNGLNCLAHVDVRQNLANDLVIATERGDVSQMSVGFVVAEDHWDSDFMNRTVTRYADMPDVSAVTYPASPTTSIKVAQRMMMGFPVQTRARLREAYKIMHDVRAGKVLNSTNAALIAAALESMHRADDVDLEEIVTRLQSVDEALDVGMAALANVSGLPNPDDDDDDAGPTTDEGEGIRETDEEREEREAVEAEAAEAERVERELELEQAAEERKKAANRAQAELLKIKRKR